MLPSAYDLSFGLPQIPSIGASSPTASYLKTALPASRTPLTGINGMTGTVPGAAVPALSAPSAAASSGGLGWNMGTAELALGGLQTIGSLWQAWEANKLAKEQFSFSKDFANTNLANQIQSYNTTLEDRSRARAFTEGQTPEQAAAYIAANRLPNRTV